MSELVVEPYTVDHYRALFGTEPDGTACLNQISGPGFALIADGQVLAIGGVRVQGIGQAWAAFAPGFDKKAKTILRTAREVIGHCIASERLYRVYAEATVDKPAWFKHLGFRQSERLFVR